MKEISEGENKYIVDGGIKFMKTAQLPVSVEKSLLSDALVDIQKKLDELLSLLKGSKHGDV